MIDKHTDISDNEIRVISSTDNRRRRGEYVRRNIVAVIVVVIAILVIGVVLAYFISRDGYADDAYDGMQYVIEESAVMSDNDTARQSADNEVQTAQHYTELRDTVINNITLCILTPFNSTPVLEIGDDVLSDTTAVLVAQAADIRRDNGRIVGAYVMRGELISKGEAKAGFCSIINGEITVGVSDATPMLEQALVTDGYFFRQYPLVVGGQLVENKPKGRSIRKALAEIDDRICVIISRQRVTFHDFSQALVDLGVRNAIYLVGSNSLGLYKDAEGRRYTFGRQNTKTSVNTNYIIWR